MASTALASCGRGRYPSSDGRGRFGDFHPGQVRSEAEVHARVEGQDGRQSLAGDVEAVGVIVDRRITFGCSGIRENHYAGGKDDPGELDILSGGTQ